MGTEEYGGERGRKGVPAENKKRTRTSPYYGKTLVSPGPATAIAQQQPDMVLHHKNHRTISVHQPAINSATLYSMKDYGMQERYLHGPLNYGTTREGPDTATLDMCRMRSDVLTTNDEWEGPQLSTLRRTSPFINELLIDTRVAKLAGEDEELVRGELEI
jgi:hypothetical protein